MKIFGFSQKMKILDIEFEELKPGCIHLYCRNCKRIDNNSPKKLYDPEDAVLLSYKVCNECTDISKLGFFGGLESMIFYDKDGKATF